MFTYHRSYRGKLQAVILDWSGTTVDYGCVAPAKVFVDVFAGLDAIRGPNQLIVANASNGLNVDGPQSFRPLPFLPNYSGYIDGVYSFVFRINQGTAELLSPAATARTADGQQASITGIAVPEPGTLALLGSALALLSMVRRKGRLAPASRAPR